MLPPKALEKSPPLLFPHFCWVPAVHGISWMAATLIQSLLLSSPWPPALCVHLWGSYKNTSHGIQGLPKLVWSHLNWWHLQRPCFQIKSTLFRLEGGSGWHEFWGDTIQPLQGPSLTLSSIVLTIFVVIYSFFGLSSWHGNAVRAGFKSVLFVSTCCLCLGHGWHLKANQNYFF